jgi:hypothetical protein
MVKPLMMHCRASHTVDMACIVQNLPLVLYPSGRKTAHRGTPARCQSAPGKTRLQTMMPSGKNLRRATTARQTHLLPQTTPQTTTYNPCAATAAASQASPWSSGQEASSFWSDASDATAVTSAAATTVANDPATSVPGAKTLTGASTWLAWISRGFSLFDIYTSPTVSGKVAGGINSVIGETAGAVGGPWIGAAVGVGCGKINCGKNFEAAGYGQGLAGMAQACAWSSILSPKK